jgi:hypothetical protein
VGGAAAMHEERTGCYRGGCHPALVAYPRSVAPHLEVILVDKERKLSLTRLDVHELYPCHRGIAA